MPGSDPGIRVWDIVKVQFPYTNRAVRQYRPALVVAVPHIADAPGLLWVVMITSAANRGWAGDVAVTDLALAGLPEASIVRPVKIATIEARDAQKIGCLDATGRAAVAAQIAALFVP